MDQKRNPDLDDALSVAGETMEELVSIVESMHDMSSFDYRKKIFDMVEIDVRHLLNVIYKEMKIFFSERNIDFKVTFNGPNVLVKGDVKRIKRSIRELIQNALKYTPDEGSVTIEYSVNETNNKLYIKISDSGIGIPLEKQNLIFEPFYEVQNAINHMTSKTEFMGGGIGLGLTLAKEVFESHEGDLIVESQEKAGSTFIAVLPYTRVAESQ